jgi:hypothetical protein
LFFLCFLDMDMEGELFITNELMELDRKRDGFFSFSTLSEPELFSLESMLKCLSFGTASESLNTSCC